MVYLNVCIIYLNVFGYIYCIFVVYFNVSIIYFDAFIVCFNVFQFISMCLNVFIDIVIGISPLHSHCNVFAMHTRQYISFLLYTMTPFSTCYTTTFFFFHSRWSVPTFKQSIITFNVFTSLHILHSTFQVVTGCTEHSKVQIIIYYYK
jgi:hypothetical protein